MSTARRDPSTRLPDFDSGLAPQALAHIQQGVMRYTYRGVLCNKSPFDLALYQLLLHKLKPKSIIEIGTKLGGSGIWLADMAQIHCGRSRIIQVDIQDRVTSRDDRVEYYLGDANKLELTLSAELLRALKKPWLVIEDSAHTYETCRAVMEFMNPWLIQDDYLVVEDGIVRNMPGARYAAYDDGPSRAIADFLEAHPRFEVDRELCDFFGPNFTYNPSGYLTVK